MSDIETEKFRQIGIDLINEYRQQRGIRLLDWLVIDTPENSAFIRSIQLHEKTKQELQDTKQEFDNFRQEVSDAVVAYFKTDNKANLREFIITKPKPDPLVEVLEKMGWYIAPNGPTDAENFRAALDALGFEIREKNDGHS
jgi:vacuolar-type H+-ATPase subunit I/STV1